MINEIVETEFTMKYDTSVNIIGSIKDINIFFDIFNAYFSDQETSSNFIENSNFSRTVKSRTRIISAVQKVFLRFYSQEHQDLIKGIFYSTMPDSEKKIILLWQFVLNNRLFREISIEVFCKAYFSGRLSVSRDDIIGFLKELSPVRDKQLSWSEKTINIMATKYISFMSKMNLLDGGRNKVFKHVRLSSELLTLFLYFAKIYQYDNNDILSNPFLPMAFIAPEDLTERLKKLSMRGLFNMNRNGVTLNIELTHSYEGICDVLYNRI